MDKISIDIHCEFGVELVLATPYAYWLHTQNKLGNVYVAKDMKPFYYFSDKVIEKYSHRTIDNSAAGLDSFPNNWLHHNAMSIFGKDYSELTEQEQNESNGFLDYTQWTPPPFSEIYKNDRFVFDKEIVVINNSFNIEAGSLPTRYFSIECLYQMFNSLIEKGYKIIYRRPKNNDLPTEDQNEKNSYKLGDIEANVEGIGKINDYDLVKYFEDVILFDDLLKQNSDLSYNTLQCMLYANCNKFISYVGGAGILCSLFGGTNIMWLSRGKETRKNYFSKNGYYNKLSDCKIITVLDKQQTFPHKIENYYNLLKTIKTTF
jgi:hypothetical protein